MKEWYVGVDGGGTKTDFAVSRQDGIPVVKIQRGGCSYQALGIDGAVDVIAEGITTCLKTANILPEECVGCCLGIPCFGEVRTSDAILVQKLEKRLAPIPVYIVNDVEVGWAGALECQPGIHIVAGTGAIAFGKGNDGQSARCGGWNEFFGDEGSCYWLGREAMSLFTKEADGRIPKGALYEIVKTGLGLTEDIDFIDYVIKEAAPHREVVAAFQLYASKAAKLGDAAALSLYERAAQELVLLVQVLRKQLSLPDSPTVSYSGGLFLNGDLILQPVSKVISACGCTLQVPKRSSLDGALLMAITQFH